MPRRLLPLVVAVALVAAGVVVGSAAPASALNDPLYAKQWGLQIIGAKAAWDAGIEGDGVDIAVLDTGVHLAHQDLVGRLEPGQNFIDPTKPPQDDECDPNNSADCGHGTHVAGIAAASIDNGGSVGVAPRARIMPVKVLGSDGSGTTDTIAAGMHWAVDHGAEVINLSLGGDLQAVSGPRSALVDATRYAWSKGVICVFAAGNQFLLGSGFSNEPAMVVSATNRQDGKPDFSSGVGAAKWGIAAPGGGDTVQVTEDEDIWSTVWDPSNRTDLYGTKRGTSMAAPFVSGAAALLRSAGLTPQQTVDRLLATAKDLGAAGKDSTFGAGRLDVAKATAGLSPAPVAGPAPTTPATSAVGGAPAPAPAATTRTTAGRLPPTAGTAATTAAGPAPTAPPDTAAPTADAPSTTEVQATGEGSSSTSAPAPLTVAAPKRSGHGGPGAGTWIAAALAALALLAVAAWAWAASRRGGPRSGAAR